MISPDERTVAHSAYATSPRLRWWIDLHADYRQIMRLGVRLTTRKSG
jgi:hypothetical protein